MKSFRSYLTESKRSFNRDDAESLGKKLAVDWSMVNINQFIQGLSVESEHNDGGKLDVVDSDLDLAKIVLAHLKEVPDYYSKLKSVEEEVPANSLSGNGVAGLREPIVGRKRRSTNIARR
jgi:hypothetical protein